MMENGNSKPLPKLEGLAGEFYAWCRRGELRFQRCRDCHAWRHMPREMCAECGSWDWQWEASSGRGIVFTWTVATRAMHPAFECDAPFAPTVVELDEGVRLVSHIVDCSPEALEIGMPVEVVFETLAADLMLPKFRCLGAREAR